MRGLAGLAIVALVAGCAAGPAPVARSDGGSVGDEQATRLKAGMTENQAFEIFGPETGFERDPENFDISCLSYAYGSAETPLYVHAVFEFGALIRATDGHPAICTFETAADAAVAG